MASRQGSPRLSRFILVLALLSSLAQAYLERCPKACNCRVGSLVCRRVDEFSWHSVQVYLSAPDAATILNVTIRGGDIPSLAYFPFLSNLELLDLSENNIQFANFPSTVRFPNLRTLLMDRNVISELSEDSFTAFSNLEHLSLRENNISNIRYEFFKLIKLRRLDLSFNKIKTLPPRVFRLLASLETLELSGNEIWRAHSSDFQSQQRLRTLNMSYNQIRQFDFDTFAKNVRIENLDLSYNNLRRSPGSDLKQVVNLLVLNISGNPMERISSWDFEFDRLQVIIASNMSELRVIDASAFSKSRDLRMIDLSDNHKLAYISPTAFENCSAIHSLDVRRSALEVLFASDMRDIAQVRMSGSKLSCECMLQEFDQISSSTIDDWDELTCTQHDGKLTKLSAARHDVCPPKPILPFGTRMQAQLGSNYYLYCGARSEQDHVSWTLPNGTTLPGLEPMKPPGVSVMDYFSNSLYHPESTIVPARPRVYASREWLRIDVVAPWDAGEYLCTLQRGREKVTKTIVLEVTAGPISIEATSTGPHYISLAWNQALEIQAVDRVALRLRIRDEAGIERSIMLSLHNPWTTYNVMKLRAAMNYSICLEYALAEELEHPLLSACTETATQEVTSMFSSVDVRGVLLVLGIIFLFIFLRVLSSLYYRMHVWQQAKKRSRMAASMSGQSIVSHTSSMNGATYENQQLALCRVDSTSETSARLLDVPV